MNALSFFYLASQRDRMKREKHYLSKSTYIRGLQCLKSLYLYKKRYFLRDRLSPLQSAKFRRGHQVGLLARSCWPGGIDLSPKSPSQYAQSVEKTMNLICDGTEKVLYEAAFQYNQVLVMMDILVKEDTGWIAYEVKSSLGISQTYLEDAALQYYVMMGAGLPLEDIRILHLDGAYHREEDLDIARLFRWESVLEFAKGRRHFIEQNIASMLKIKDLEKSPSIPPGQHCFAPYPCDFIGHCWKSQKLPEIEWMEKWGSAWKTLIEQKKDASLYQKSTILLTFFTTKPAIPVFPGNTPFTALLAGIGTLDLQSQRTTIAPGAYPQEKPETLVSKLIAQTEHFQVIVVDDASAFQHMLKGLIIEYPHLSIPLELLDKKAIGLRELIEDSILQNEPSQNPGYPGSLLLARHLGLVERKESTKIDTQALAGEAYRLIMFSDRKDSTYRTQDIEAFLKYNCLAMNAIYKSIL